ncbi:hypothetical protein PRIPAC_83405 [Pristionchus pacificus]|uniref:Uncharacterized protein n=1 Tax=Pristionchus pacificus TaxID=54126 RepID=A0A2A6BIH2_PRIPA|nr:hypothetical protein PRIPAC_83405 [Pristionchus pacificus]|eukprot:PDM65626.1 hypothetical protein PRIPAC_53634 [Pristionchus pacificus]
MDDQSKIERKKAKVREENKSGKGRVMHRATLIQSGPEEGANKWTSVIGDDTIKRSEVNKWKDRQIDLQDNRLAVAPPAPASQFDSCKKNELEVE